MLGDTDMALKLTERTVQDREDLCPAIFSLWDRVLNSPVEQKFTSDEIKQRIRQGECKP